jgi:hypothetical protein
MEGGCGDEEPEELGEQRRQPGETKIGSDIHHPEPSDCSHNTGDEDKDPRPAKRRRLSPTRNGLTLPGEPAPVANDNHLPSRTSQNPSVTVESALVAEYREWPFQGLLDTY